MRPSIDWTTAFILSASFISYTEAVPCLEHSSQNNRSPSSTYQTRPSAIYLPTPSSATSSAGVTSSSNGAPGQQSHDEPHMPKQPALLPAVHWAHPKTDYRNLAPMSSHNLYYSARGVSDPSLEHVFVHLTADLKHPAVVLEHSSYVESVQCAPEGIRITFQQNQAYQYAKKSWAKTDTFMLVTYTNGCGSSSEQRTFWLVDHIETDLPSLSIIAVAQEEMAVEDAMQGVDMVWGSYKPGDASSVPFKQPPRPDATGSYPYKGYPPHGSPPYGSSGNVNGSATAYSSGNLFTATHPSSSGPTSSGSPATARCGKAPSAQIDGFPTAPCGSETFDQQLDDEIGYLSFDDAEYEASLRDFAPGLDDFSASDNDGFGTLRRRRRNLQKRNWFMDNIVKPVGKAFNDAGKAIKKVGEGIVDGVKKVGKTISDALAISPEVSADVPIEFSPGDKVNSPWGPAVKLFEKDKNSDGGAVKGELALYCVECGVTGQIHLGGQARWTIAEGLTKANVDMKGTVEAGLSLGIDAKATVSEKFPFPIATIGPPGFRVPNIISIGPTISLSAEVELGVTIEGTVRAGVRMTIADFSANLDLVDGSKSASKIEPKFEKIFEAKAKIEATAALGLPLSIGIGIETPPIRFKKSASITEQPSIAATITYQASTTCLGIGGDDDKKCINGVGYKLEFKNDVYADLFGLKKFDLHKLSVPLIEGCEKVPSIGPTTCSSQSTAASTASSAGLSSTGSASSGTASMSAASSTGLSSTGSESSGTLTASASSGTASVSGVSSSGLSSTGSESSGTLTASASSGVSSSGSESSGTLTASASSGTALVTGVSSSGLSSTGATSSGTFSASESSGIASASETSSGLSSAGSLSSGTASASSTDSAGTTPGTISESLTGTLSSTAPSATGSSIVSESHSSGTASSGTASGSSASATVSNAESSSSNSMSASDASQATSSSPASSLSSASSSSQSSDAPQSSSSAVPSSAPTSSATPSSTLASTTAHPSSTPSAAAASSTSAPAPVEKRDQASPTPTAFPWRHSIPVAKRSDPDPFSFVEDSGLNAPADDASFQTLNNAALQEASTQNATTNGTSVSTAPDATSVTINDKSGSYSLFADADGNLYVETLGQGSTFAAVDSYVVGDDSGRFLHYYPDVMRAYNVSRLRLSSQDMIPKDADFVALVPADYNDDKATPDIYAGFDTTGGMFFTISCDIEDQASKVFLVADPVEGAKTLMDPKLRWTVTGGVVQDCYYLPWVRPARGV